MKTPYPSEDVPICHCGSLDGDDDGRESDSEGMPEGWDADLDKDD